MRNRNSILIFPESELTNTGASKLTRKALENSIRYLSFLELDEFFVGRSERGNSRDSCQRWKIKISLLAQNYNVNNQFVLRQLFHFMKKNLFVFKLENFAQNTVFLSRKNWATVFVKTPQDILLYHIIPHFID